LQDEQTKLKAKLPALGVKDKESTGFKLNKDKAISAIEAKLVAMEREKGQMGFSISSSNKASSSSSSNSTRSWNPGQSVMNKPQPPQQHYRFNNNHNNYKTNDRHNRKPYSR
jgi:hypothetical protein